jgi:hypothetical protein
MTVFFGKFSPIQKKKKKKKKKKNLVDRMVMCQISK